MQPAYKVSSFCSLAGFRYFFLIACSAEQQQNVPWKIDMTRHLSVIHSAFVTAVSGTICLTATPHKTVSHTHLFPSCSYSFSFLLLWVPPCPNPLLISLFLHCTKNSDFRCYFISLQGTIGMANLPKVANVQ